MDAFFASIEMRDDPGLRSKPVVVGSDPRAGKGRGVVSACSYEARRFGIRSAMPISEAYRRCPGAAFLPVDIKKYSAVSEEIYRIFYSFTPDIEAVGIDEAFLDITGSFHLFGTPAQTCLLIKSRIRKDIGLTASIGLAPSRIAAKIASDLKKPDGFVEVPDGSLKDFLNPLDVRRLWGLGPKAEAKLKSIGVNTVGELAARPAGQITDILGQGGLVFWDIANGRDESALEPERNTKSAGNELTFESDTSDREIVESALMDLSEKVAGRLRSAGLKAKTVTLKIRLSSFKTYTRAASLHKHTNITDSLYNAVKELYNEFAAFKIRLVGVKASNFSGCRDEGDLFTGSDEKKLEDIDLSMDKIKGRFGDSSIYRASAKKHKG